MAVEGQGSKLKRRGKEAAIRKKSANFHRRRNINELHFRFNNLSASNKGEKRLKFMCKVFPFLLLLLVFPQYNKAPCTDTYGSRFSFFFVDSSNIFIYEMFFCFLFFIFLHFYNCSGGFSMHIIFTYCIVIKKGNKSLEYSEFFINNLLFVFLFSCIFRARIAYTMMVETDAVFAIFNNRLHSKYVYLMPRFHSPFVVCFFLIAKYTGICCCFPAYLLSSFVSLKKQNFPYLHCIYITFTFL